MTHAESSMGEQTPLLDEETVALLYGSAENQPDQQALVQMLSGLLADLTEGLGSLDVAWNASDGVGGRERCHRLRGVLANYGFSGAADLLAKGEMLAEGALMSAQNRREVRTRIVAGLAELQQRHPYLSAVTISPSISPAND